MHKNVSSTESEKSQQDLPSQLREECFDLSGRALRTRDAEHLPGKAEKETDWAHCETLQTSTSDEDKHCPL